MATFGAAVGGLSKVVAAVHAEVVVEAFFVSQGAGEDYDYYQEDNDCAGEEEG